MAEVVRPRSNFTSSFIISDLVACKRRAMARAAATCLVLSWACLGVGVRLFESHGESEGLAVTKNPMHGVTGATPNGPTDCEKAHHKKDGKGTGKGFLKSPNRALPSQPQGFLVVSLNLQGFCKGRPTGCPMAHFENGSTRSAVSVCRITRIT